MLRYAAPLELVIQELERLPGVGPKSAQRLALHMMRMDPREVESLGAAIMALRQSMRECVQCHNYSAGELCPICQDRRRDAALLCVVEGPSDVMALERAGEFEGLYHVLGGTLSPLSGVGPEDLHIPELLVRVTQLRPREVVLATSPTVDGDATAEYLRGRLAERNPEVLVSRIALGLPVGSDLDYADQVTVARALRGRRPMED